MKNLFAALGSMLGVGPGDPSLHLSPEEAHQKLKAGTPPLLVDVRTREEYREARIPGSKLVPLHELDQRMRELDKTRSILLYCRSGARSGAALRMLKGKNYPRVSHIRGGIIAWARMGLPMEKER